MFFTGSNCCPVARDTVRAARRAMKREIMSADGLLSRHKQEKEPVADLTRLYDTPLGPDTG